MDPHTRDAVGTASARWQLRLEGAPRVTPSSEIAFGRRGSTPVVLKVVAPASDERNGAAALRHFGGVGAVRLLAHEAGALLLERATPGHDLVAWVAAGRDDQATGVLCDVVSALHRSPASSANLPTRLPTVEDWGASFTTYRASPDRRLPSLLVDRAAHLHAELAASQGERRLLHGDLHHYNVLFDAARGWLAIDPKGSSASRPMSSAPRSATLHTSRRRRAPRAVAASWRSDSGWTASASWHGRSRRRCWRRSERGRTASTPASPRRPLKRSARRAERPFVRPVAWPVAWLEPPAEPAARIARRLRLR